MRVSAADLFHTVEKRRDDDGARFERNPSLSDCKKLQGYLSGWGLVHMHSGVQSHSSGLATIRAVSESFASGRSCWIVACSTREASDALYLDAVDSFGAGARNVHRTCAGVNTFHWVVLLRVFFTS